MLQGMPFLVHFAETVANIQFCSAPRLVTLPETAQRLVDTVVVDSVVTRADTAVDLVDEAAVAVALVDRPATPAGVTDTCLVSFPLTTSVRLSLTVFR